MDLGGLRGCDGVPDVKLSNNEQTCYDVKKKERKKEKKKGGRKEGSAWKPNDII